MAPLTLPGRDLIGNFITGTNTSSQVYTNTYAWMHVGSSTAAFTANVNTLVGSGVTSGGIKSMDATFPTYSVTSGGAPVLTFRATYTTSEAVMEWNEWGVKNSSATASSTGSGILLNRLLSTVLGAKANTQSWQLTGQITVTT